MKSQIVKAEQAEQPEFPRLMTHEHWGVILVLGAGGKASEVRGVTLEQDIGREINCFFLHMMTPFCGKVILES